MRRRDERSRWNGLEGQGRSEDQWQSGDHGVAGQRGIESERLAIAASPARSFNFLLRYGSLCELNVTTRCSVLKTRLAVLRGGRRGGEEPAFTRFQIA
jgi:hypothetical protein